MKALEGIETPALLLDRARLTRNVQRMEERARSLGVKLRPHLKTCKSVDVAHLIPSAASHGITVSTVKEAEYFAAAGLRDQLLAVAVAPSRLRRVAALLRDGVRTRVALDSPVAIDWLEDAASREGVRFEALVEIDCGEHRSGVTPDSDLVPQLASRLARGRGTRFGGIFTHAGHSYGARDREALRAVAEQERAAIATVRERIESIGIDVPIASVGSTPTATHAASLHGVTEIRAGVYVFHDLFQAAIGSCGIDDIATTVLATVIGHQRAHGRILIDAGGLAMSKDRSTMALGAHGDCGYGLLADVDSGQVFDGVLVSDVYQEHGVITARPGSRLDFDRFPLGSRVRVLPNHSCMTCSAYDAYHVIDGDAQVALWPRIHEWSRA
ncbi:MAG: alanine racemase [Planctomycetota bacterium]